MSKFTHENGKPVTQGWIVRQAFPNATVVDQAHRAFGLWSVPADAGATGSVEVVVEPPYLGQRGTRERISWAPFVRATAAVR